VRRSVWLSAAAALLVGAGGFVLYRDLRPRESARSRELRAVHESLHRQLESHFGAEPLLAQSEVDSGDVVVAIRTPYLGTVIREVTRRYLDRVRLDLAPHVHVHETGEVKKKTFLGEMKLGEWSVHLTIDRLQSTLAGATPVLKVAADNTVALTLPVTILEAKGAGRIHFAWDSKAMANIVCKDFEVEEDLVATAMSEKYHVRGALTLAAEGDHIIGRPVFPHDRYRVRIDLTPESWAKVEAALRAQDTLGRCGIAIKPEQHLPKLRELANKGFEFKLPRSLFRPIVLPARIESQVNAFGQTAEVKVEPRLLRLTDEVLWYGASVHARLTQPLPLPGARAPHAR
jgi:hypothetical protein